MGIAIIEQVEQKALSVPEQAREFHIATNDQFLAADTILSGWREIENQIHTAFDPVVEAANKAHKEAVAQRKKYLDPIEQGRAILKPKMAEWQREQERIRQEEQYRAEEEARKRAEEEQIAAAVAAERVGETEVAEKILSAPVQAAPVFVPKQTPKTQTTFRTQWYAEVIDIKALCRAVAEGKASPECVLPNMPVLNRLASAMKSTMNTPGVAAKSRTV